MPVSGRLSDSCSRRLFLLMVVPLKKGATMSMIYSGAPEGRALKAYIRRY